MSTKLNLQKLFNKKKSDDASLKNPKNIFHNDDKITITNIFCQQPSGINGGTFPSGKWITRPLNAINGNDSISLNPKDNTFTLKKGIYLINCDAPAFNVGVHQARLFNVTDNVTAKYGTSSSANGSSSNSMINYLTIHLKVPTTFSLQHRCQTSQASTGLGIASGFPSNDSSQHFEIFGNVEIIHLN